MPPAHITRSDERSSRSDADGSAWSTHHDAAHDSFGLQAEALHLRLDDQRVVLNEVPDEEGDQHRHCAFKSGHHGNTSGDEEHKVAECARCVARGEM